MPRNCSICGAKISGDARFCGQCGENVGALSCGACGYVIPGGADFCPGCGKLAAESAAPQTARGRWSRGTDHFATKVDADDLKGLFTRGLRVEQGTRALLFVDGRYIEALPPGFHNLSSPILADKSLQKLITGQGKGTIVLVSAGDQELVFTVADLRDREQFPVDASGSIVTRVADPSVFYINMMGGRQNVRLEDLGAWLQDELRDALAEAVAGLGLGDLVPGSQAVKERLEVDIAGHLKRSMDRNGLELVQVRSLRLTNPQVESLRDQRAAIKLESRKVDVYRERVDVLARMRDAVNSSKMDTVRSEEEMAVFLQEIDKGKILRSEELEAFVRTFEEKKDDHRLARFHVLKKLELEQEFELSHIRLVEQGQLYEAGLDRELALERKRLEARREQETTQFEQSLRQQGAKFDQALRQKKATTDAEIDARRKASELKREEAREGVELVEKMKLAKHQRQKDLAELEARTRAEALKTKAGLTPDQLALIEAADSPALAEALKEKFRSEHVEARRADAERHHERLVDEMRENQKRQDDLAREALRTQRDATGAVAAGRGAAPGTGSGPQTGDQIVCRKCTTMIELKPLLKFCPKCGEPVS